MSYTPTATPTKGPTPPVPPRTTATGGPGSFVQRQSALFNSNHIHSNPSPQTQFPISQNQHFGAGTNSPIMHSGSTNSQPYTPSRSPAPQAVPQSPELPPPPPPPTNQPGLNNFSLQHNHAAYHSTLSIFNQPPPSAPLPILPNSTPNNTTTIHSNGPQYTIPVTTPSHTRPSSVVSANYSTSVPPLPSNPPSSIPTSHSSFGLPATPIPPPPSQPPSTSVSPIPAVKNQPLTTALAPKPVISPHQPSALHSSGQPHTPFFVDDRDSDTDDVETAQDATDNHSFKLTVQQQRQNMLGAERRGTTMASNHTASILDNSLFNSPDIQPTIKPTQIIQTTLPLGPIDMNQVKFLQSKKPYGTLGLRSEPFPNSPDHSRILQLIRTRSMSLYNAVYRINKTFTNIPVPNQTMYNKFVMQTPMITERLDKFGDKKNNSSSDAKLLQLQEQQQHQQIQHQQTPAMPIGQALKQYPDILASCLENQDLTNNIMMLLNSIFELQRAHTLDFDTATTIEAAYAYSHQKLEVLQQQEDESKRKSIALTKEFLALKLKEDHKKIEKAAQAAYTAIRAYEQDRRESCYQITHTDLASTGTVLKPLRTRLQSYYDYYRRGFELMKPFEGVLKDLERRCELDDEAVNAGLTALSHEQERLEREQKIHLQRLGLTEHFSPATKDPNPLLADLTSGLLGEQNRTTGIRDLDNTKLNKELGTQKKGFLFTPPQNASRVWVELRDRTLRVSEEQQPANANAKSSAANQGGEATSRFQNLLDKVTAQEKEASKAQASALSPSVDNIRDGSSATSYKVIFETSTQLLTAKAVRDSKYRNVFQVIGPTGSCFLQAESDTIMNEWLDVIQNAVGADLTLEQQQKGGGKLSTGSIDNNPHSRDGHLQKRRSLIAQQMAANGGQHSEQQHTYNPTVVMAQLRSVPGNTTCCDCAAPDPDWISINLGVLICLDCSGAHRQLGVSVSKIRSVKMDKLDPHIVNYCLSLGNALVNHILLEFYQYEQEQEAKLGGRDPTLHIGIASPRNEKLDHIKCKYQDKRWVLQDILLTSKTRAQLTPSHIEERSQRLSTLLYNGVRQDSITNVFRACISGVDPTQTMGNENVPPLFEAILYNFPTFLTCMLQFTEQVNYRESRGWNCLHYAAYVNSLEMCELCISICGSELAMAVDGEGKTPREVALLFNSQDEEFSQDLPLILNCLQQAETKYLQKMAKQ